VCRMPLAAHRVLALLDSDRVAARDEGYRLIVAHYARKALPAEVVAALTRRLADGPPWSDRLVAALVCGEAPAPMAVILRVLDGGTMHQQRSMIAQLWHRPPVGPIDELHALVGRVATGTGTLAFDAAHLLASRGDDGAVERIVEMIVASDGTPESLRHYALETLADELRRAVDDGLRARGATVLRGDVVGRR
jgi:hypothetical protein